DYTERYEGSRVTHCAAGLLYRHYGRQVLRAIIEATPTHPTPTADNPNPSPYPPVNLTDEELENLYHRVYKGFVEEVDGVDNGYGAAGLEDNPRKQGDVTNYSQGGTSLGSRIHHGNGIKWNDPIYKEEYLHPEATMELIRAKEDAAFNKAVDMVRPEFEAKVRGTYFGPMRIAAYIAKHYEARHSIHPSGRIMVLDEPVPRGMVNGEILSYEEKKGLDPMGPDAPCFCLFPKTWNPTEPNHRVLALKRVRTSFENRYYYTSITSLILTSFENRCAVFILLSSMLVCPAL
ncbi:metal-dependent protein hydrolase, partial [Kipferlia bialata]